MSLRAWIWRLLVYPTKRLIRPWRRQYRAIRRGLADRAENRRWQVSPPLITVVSEPGSQAPFYWHFLDWLGHERPDLRAHVHLGRLPARLPQGTAMLHAWVQDPVAERDPQVYTWLARLEAECARRGVEVVHPVAVLSNSKRDVICDRLARIGVRTPRVVVVDDSFHAHRAGLGFPMVVRPRWGHAAGLRCLETEASFRTWWADAHSKPHSWVAGEFIDVRSSDGCYRKYRYFMAGSRGIPRHLIVSPNWEVRPVDRVRTAATRDEELAFVTARCPHHESFDKARKALDFEIAAFDYSYDTSGDLVVWEVNPYPDLSRPKGEVGDYLRATIEQSYAILADFYAERAGTASR